MSSGTSVDVVQPEIYHLKDSYRIYWLATERAILASVHFRLYALNVTFCLWFLWNCCKKMIVIFTLPEYRTSENDRA